MQGPERDNGKFVTGKSGNVGGKPRETRNKLSGVFLRSLLSSFEKDGVSAIDKVIRTDPAAYLRVIASIIPKELEITNSVEELTDDQLSEVIASLRSAISTGIVAQASGAKAIAEQTQDVPPVH